MSSVAEVKEQIVCVIYTLAIFCAVESDAVDVFCYPAVVVIMK